jgi:hypothetical protein
LALTSEIIHCRGFVLHAAKSLKTENVYIDPRMR